MSKPQRPEKMTAPSKDNPVSEHIQKGWVGEDTDHKDWVADDSVIKHDLGPVGGDAFKPVEIDADDLGVISPRDSASGLATGRRQHEPIRGKDTDHKGDIGGGADGSGVDAFNYEVKLTNGIKGDAFEEIAFAKPMGTDGDADGRSIGLDFPSLEAEADDEFIDIDFPSLEAEADDEFMDSDFKGGDGVAPRSNPGQIKFDGVDGESRVGPRDVTQIKFDGVDGESRVGQRGEWHMKYEGIEGQRGVHPVDQIEQIVGDEIADLPDAVIAKATFAGDDQPETQMVFTNDTIDKAVGDQTETQFLTDDTIDADTMDLTYQKIETVVIEEPPQDFTESAVWQDDWETPPAVADDGDGMGLDG